MPAKPEIYTPNLRPYDKDNGEAGIIIPTGDWLLQGGVAMSANQARFSRFVPSRRMTILSISFVVSGASTGDVDVGIYNAAGTTKLGSSGATSGKLTATGTKNVALSAGVTLLPGVVYYGAISVSSTPTLTCSTYSFGTFPELFGTAPPDLLTGSEATAHPLPSTLSGYSTAAGPILALKES